MNTAQLSPNYLKVRYSTSARPLTAYPEQLCRYLSDTYLSQFKNAQLLDLGCGRGEFLDAFARLGFDAMGVDREGSEKSDAGCPVRICNLETDALPIANASVDVIFNKSVLEHVREITPLLRECERVLKPGGVMVSLVPDFRAQWRHFYDDWTHVRPFTLTGLRECFLSHDFELLEAKRFRQLPLLWKHPYLRPLADVAEILPATFKRSKWVRFSQEWMLLAVVQKPLESFSTNTRGHDD